jgi:uncharacterized protein YbjT (DUF2867 family)
MILLTGATGSVGRHVAADLIAKGLDVRVVVRDPETALFGDESYADGALDTWAGFVTRPERVTATVEEITGVTARSFRQ